MIGALLNLVMNFTSSDLVEDALAYNKVVQTPSDIFCAAIAQVREVGVGNRLRIHLTPHINKARIQ